MIVVYIAGPYRGANAWEVHQNIERAQALAYEVWEAGMVAICPHNNTRHFDGTLTDEVWLEGDLELLRRSDAILMTPRWAMSVGASAERLAAIAAGIPVYYTARELTTRPPTSRWKEPTRG